MTTQQAAPQELPVDDAGFKKAAIKGLWGAFWLTVLTIGEFIVFSAGDGESWLTVALLPFILLKAWIILDTFMHIRALWGDDH